MADRAIPSGAEHTGERKSQDVYERLRILEETLNRNPFTRGRLLDTDPDPPSIPGAGILFASGQTRTLAHGLGRPCRGVLEVLIPDAAYGGPVWIYPAAYPSGLSKNTHISVQATNAGLCLILVF